MAQLGLAAGLCAITYAANAEAQDARPPTCVSPDAGAPVPCPGGTTLVPGPRSRMDAGTTRRPETVSACGDSGAHSPVTNVDTYLRDPEIHARIERVHPGLDVSHGSVYTITVPVSVSRLTWDEGRAEPRIDTRNLPANRRVYGVRVNNSGAYDANGSQIRLVLDTNCGDVINGTISVDNASMPVAPTPVTPAPTPVTPAHTTPPPAPNHEEPSRVRDDTGTPRRTSGDDPSEGRAADAYAPPPESRGPYVEIQLGGGAMFGTQGGTEVRNVDRISGVNNSFRITASNPTPELSASGHTGRYIAVLNISGGTAPYTVNIPGIEVAPTSGGNSYNVIGTPGTYTATITDGNGHTEMIPVNINGSRITAGNGGTTITTHTTESNHVDYHTVMLPTVGILVGGRPFGRGFDIAGGVEAGFLLEQAITRNAMGNVLSSSWDIRPWDFNLQLRLGALLANNHVLLGGRARVHFVTPLDGLETTLTMQYNSHGQLDAPSFIAGVDLGASIPFHPREGAWSVNPVARGYVGLRF